MFGVALTTLVMRENPGISDFSGLVPRAFEACLSEIERRGLTEIGICELQLLSRSPHRPLTSFCTSQIESQGLRVQSMQSVVSWTKAASLTSQMMTASWMSMPYAGPSKRSCDSCRNR